MKQVFSGLVALGLTLSLMGQAKADYDFTTLDLPGAIETYCRGINDCGQIVGYYRDASGYHGFLLEVDGTYTTLDVPGGTVTAAYGINANGQIVGSFDAGARTAGFLLEVDGTYTTLDVPGATYTSAYGINCDGTIVGIYRDAAGLSHGFLATPECE